VTIWLYSLFGKEQMMMPYFLRYYAPQVDRLIMLSGGTDEETRAMVWQYKNAEVHRSPFSETNYDDQAFIEYAQERYKEARGHADWVVWVDVDEFLYTPIPLRDALDHYRGGEIHAVQCDGYQMVAPSFPEYTGEPLTSLVKVGAYDKIYNKVCAFDPMLDVRWSVGRHSCDIDGLFPTPTGMKLLHYRYFGDEWLKARNARNHARRSQKDIETGCGYHVAPDYDGGRYSAAWYKQILEHGEEVI